MTHDEMIAVIKAHHDGYKVQRSNKGGMATGKAREWIIDENPKWNFEYNYYRIKPEPLTLDECWDKAMEITKTAGGVLEEFLKQAKENGHV